MGAKAYCSAYIRMMDEVMLMGNKEELPEVSENVSYIKEKSCFFTEDRIPEYKIVFESGEFGGCFSVYYRGDIIDCFFENRGSLTLKEREDMAREYFLNIIDCIESSNQMMEYSYER